ncbi:MAG: MerR family transcriptional regulator, partial [Chloroflexi bacterium]|nr:MerR family transcriptional regulator [Chloroflexota bacterium]
FSSVTRLSHKALRLYGSLDLLPPAWIDPDSGYRYYRSVQVRDARLIRSLREVGMPLATIRRVLAGSPREAQSLMQSYVNSLDERARQARAALPDLIAETVAFSHDPQMEVVVRHEPQQPIISITQRVFVGQLPEYLRLTLQELREFAAGRDLRETGHPFGYFHGIVSDQDDGPLEVCLPVSRETERTHRVRSTTLPAGRAAFVEAAGEAACYPAILRAYDAVYDWITTNGYEIGGSPRETWRHSFPLRGAPDMEISWKFVEIS